MCVCIYTFLFKYSFSMVNSIFQCSSYASPLPLPPSSLNLCKLNNLKVLFPLAPARSSNYGSEHSLWSHPLASRKKQANLLFLPFQVIFILVLGTCYAFPQKPLIVSNNPFQAIFRHGGGGGKCHQSQYLNQLLKEEHNVYLTTVGWSKIPKMLQWFTNIELMVVW